MSDDVKQETREAAERLRAWIAGEFDYEQFDSNPLAALNDDREMLATAYLAEHPADSEDIVIGLNQPPPTEPGWYFVKFESEPLCVNVYESFGKLWAGWPGSAASVQWIRNQHPSARWSRRLKIQEPTP